MARHSRRSRRSRRGGDKLDDIQNQLDSIQQQVNELKNPSSAMEEPTMEQPVSESESVFEEPAMEQPVMEQPVIRSWHNDKNTKFKDGAGGRVSLSFPRIMTLIDNNINKGNTNKDWVSIKKELNDASSISDVQDIINKYKISFSSNYVAGTRKRRRVGKRRTHRRH